MEGLSMGGKLSSAIANIFLDIMEQDIIKKYFDQNILLFYGRYVDDCCLIIRKQSKLFDEMNNFDPALKFTSEPMQNNVLKYLDTKIVLNNDKIG